MPSTAPVFTADEKTALTTHLGISGGSTDAQIMAALLDRKGKGVRKVQTAPTPQCPICDRPLPNNTGISSANL
jgi:hypothetical protein